MRFVEKLTDDGKIIRRKIVDSEGEIVAVYDKPCEYEICESEKLVWIDFYNQRVFKKKMADRFDDMWLVAQENNFVVSEEHMEDYEERRTNVKPKSISFEKLYILMNTAK